MNWHNQSILKGLGVAASLVFALYLSLTAIVVIPVFNDTADRLTEGKGRLKDQLPHLLELYNKSLIAADVSEDELPDTKGLLERARQLWDNDPQEQTRTMARAADASVPMSPEPVQAKAPQTQATAVGSVNLRTLIKAELQGKILELDRQITDLRESKQNFGSRAQIIWAKNNFAIGRGHYHCKHEPCWCGAAGTPGRESTLRSFFVARVFAAASGAGSGGTSTSRSLGRTCGRCSVVRTPRSTRCASRCPAIHIPGTGGASSNLTTPAVAVSRAVGGGDEHRFDLI